MARTRTSSSSELLSSFAVMAPGPFHGQIERALRAAIRDGRLIPGTTMPSSRALAGHLDVSRGVIVEAYEQLAAEGFLVSQQGGITRVGRSRTVGAATAAPVSDRPRIDFAYGRPDVTQFPRGAWLRSVREVLNVAPSDLLSYGDPRGVPELRSALAAYLNRVRGTAVHPDRVSSATGSRRRSRSRGGPRAPARRRSPSRIRRSARPDDVCGAGGTARVAGPGRRSRRVRGRRSSGRPRGGGRHPGPSVPARGVLAADRRAELVAWARDRTG